MKNKFLQFCANRRKGMAIEMAVVFMLVVVALTGLAVSSSMLRINKVDRSYSKIELEQIGEDFCKRQESYELPQGLQSLYTATVSQTGNVTSLQVHTRAAEPKTVLTIELTKTDVYTVTKWSYGE